MTMTKRLLLGSALAAVAMPALADGHLVAGCPVEGRVAILSNDFPALAAVAARAQECAPDATVNATTEHKDIQVPALTAEPAEYTVAVVANSSLVPLLTADLVRPLDDLIAEHGANIDPGQMIKINGETMAIAFMANAQHLYMRSDLLEQAGITEQPTTWEGVIEAAQAIRDQGIMENPIALNTAAGWNLAEEFVNMYLGYGGAFFADGSAEPAIANETGVAALETLKQLAELSGPDYLTYDSNATQALWSAGEVAIAQMWGSRAANVLEESGEEIAGNTVLAGAPTVAGGATPASTLWWDGFTIAANISDEDAEASFIAMVNGIQPGVLEGNEDKAVWLIPGYEPTDVAVGVSATATGGTAPYPMLPYMGAMHNALGAELVDFLQGSEDAMTALEDAEAAYRAAATELGFLQ